MGNRSARMQKLIYPRSRTKAESLKDKIRGKPEYPSVKASQYVNVDPEQTPQYKNVLKTVALNIKSRENNPTLGRSTINQPRNLEEPSLHELGKAPPGFLSKDMLANLFTVDRHTPGIHEKYHLTEAELKKIFDWFAGYTTRGEEATSDSESVADITQSLKDKLLNVTSIDPKDDRGIMVEKLKEKERERNTLNVGESPRKFLKSEKRTDGDG